METTSEQKYFESSLQIRIGDFICSQYFPFLFKLTLSLLFQFQLFYPFGSPNLFSITIPNQTIQCQQWQPHSNQHGTCGSSKLFDKNICCGGPPPDVPIQKGCWKEESTSSECMYHPVIGNWIVFTYQSIADGVDSTVRVSSTFFVRFVHPGKGIGPRTNGECKEMEWKDYHRVFAHWSHLPSDNAGLGMPTPTLSLRSRDRYVQY